TITITYPKAFVIDGPNRVDVPAHSTVDVPMVLKTSALPPVAPPPWPPGAAIGCPILHDVITLVHPETRRSATTAGAEASVCAAFTRANRVSVQMHSHPAPNGDPAGTAKENYSTCGIYWNFHEFFPTPDAHAPEQCRSDIQDRARE